MAPSPPKVTFEFVTVTKSAPELSAESRVRIKKHVMKDIGLARRTFTLREAHEAHTPHESSKFNAHARKSSNGRQKAHFTRCKDDGAVSEDSPESAESPDNVFQTIIHLPKPGHMVGAGCIDPFATFPIQGNVEVDMLVDHINDDSHSSFRLFREYWFPLAIQDPAAFHSTLALAAQHRMTRFPAQSEERIRQHRQYVSHYAAAIRSVNLRVGDPQQNTSEDMIAAIVSLACDHASAHAAENYLRHMNGLEAIIKLRDGIETLDSNKKLRLLIFWIDTMGAAALDMSPRFPAPNQYLPNYDDAFSGKLRPRLPFNIAEEWITTFPSHMQMVEILDDLCALTVLVEREALESQAVQEPRFTGFYIVPLIHRLLSLRPIASESHEETMIFEACKLGAFLYLQNLRYFVAIRYPCLKSPFFEQKEEGAASLSLSCVQRLELIMLGHGVIWTELRPLKCWILTVGANASYKMAYRPSHLFGLP